MSSNNNPTGNNAPRPDNPNVAAPPPVPALPGPAADDADDGLIVANPIDTFGRPFLATVPFDKLHLYDAADLTASRMYQPGPCIQAIDVWREVRGVNEKAPVWFDW